jgi:hypothetical protein
MSEPVDISLALHTGNLHSQDVLKKFELAIQKVTTEHGTNNATTLTQEELTELIRNWEPQRDILCLYVRWARQLKRNFNLDSIATLLCLSQQCGYTPVDFLCKVKTLSIRKRQNAAYGVTFHFDIPERKDINRERLNREFLGLSVTLALLQEQVCASHSIFGRVQGMSQKAHSQGCTIEIPIEGAVQKQQATLATQPNFEFPTQSSLQNRIWNSINHRWLALYLTEHLFREVNLPWSYAKALVYSFEMMAPCGPGRYDFLSPLVGYCLAFPTQDSIDSKRPRLREIWDDALSFLPYGNTCLTQLSTEAQTQVIIECFQDLRSNLSSKHKQISYNRDCPWLKRWTILRAYILQMWLNSASNSTLKSIVVTNGSNANTRKGKRQSDGCLESKSQTPGGNCAITSPLDPAHLKQKKQRVARKPPETGFQTIISSRLSSKKGKATIVQSLFCKMQFH